eukprot:scaffold13774_cov161-Skeletonema_marinoi.AAC.3
MLNWANTRIASIESELDDMEKSIDTINSAASLRAGKVLYNEVSNLPQKIDACQDMIDVCRDCTSKGQLSTDSLIGNEISRQLCRKYNKCVAW